MSDTKHLKRLRYRSWHRGTREMDLLLGGFADTHLQSFNADQLEHYDSLLQESDPDLYDWITGVAPIPAAKDNDMLQLLKSYKLR